MLPAPKIVVIDDEKEDVQAILDALNALGTVAVGLHYSGAAPNLRPFPALRILFLDLHLLSGAGDTAQQIKTTIGIVSELLTPDNGPYAIVLWSGHASEYERFKREVNERLRLAERPLPLAVLSLDKSTHLTGDGEDGRKVTDPSRLKEDVLERIRENPQLAALLSWEEHVSRAADDTIRQISQLAIDLPVEESGDRATDHSCRLNRVLGELAVASAGVERAKGNVFRAANDVLVPILADRILHQSANEGTGGLWKKAVTEISPVSSWKGQDKTCAALNGFLHIERIRQDGDGDPSERGAVIDLSELSDRQFLELWGCSREDLLAELKLGSIDPCWVMVQVQAPCDQAQDRSGPLPYLLGLRSILSNSKLGEIRKRPALFASPIFEQDGKQPRLIFPLRFVIGLSRDRVASLGLPVRYRLREQLLSELTHALHGHGGRPGIIRFPR